MSTDAAFFADDEQAKRDADNAIIAAQNDTFRKSWGPTPEIQGRLFLTNGVSAMSEIAHINIIEAVCKFDEFNEDNDPYGDHSFGSFEVEDDGKTVGLFWKIDLYDTSYNWGAETPTDPQQTRRVLTIMQRSEY